MSAIRRRVGDILCLANTSLVVITEIDDNPYWVHLSGEPGVRGWFHTEDHLPVIVTFAGVLRKEYFDVSHR